MESQRDSAPALMAEISSLSFRQGKLLIRNSSRYQVWALAEELIRQARQSWSEDPERSEDLSHLALEVAARINASGFRKCLLNDLRAEAWSCVANCRRIRSNYPGAQTAFEVAEKHLAEGSGDRLESARLWDLKASLFGAQRDFSAAKRALDAAIIEYRAAREGHLEGRALIKMAKLLRDSGRIQETIPVLERASTLVDVAREPWLGFALRKNLIVHLVEAGRPEEAQKLLPEVRVLARSHASRLERLRLLWTEGLLCKGLGQSELAIEAFRQVREGFIAGEIGGDVALVSLDLAALYLETGRTEEARQLATESIPLFTSRGVHREALMAWNLFREAAERDALTLGLVEEVASRIRQSQSRPAAGGDLP